MEFEKLQNIIADVLNIDKSKITPETTFVDDLGADSLDVFQIIMGIEDEFDIAEDEGDIFGLTDHTYRVSGDTPVERVCEAFGVSIRSSDPEEEFDTIGGLIAHEIGHHVQNELGILGQANEIREQVGGQ